MEANETVMSMKQLSELNSTMPSEAKYGEVFEVIAEQQAEISFQLGMQKVVGWGDEPCPHILTQIMDGSETKKRECPTCWQAFKESIRSGG